MRNYLCKWPNGDVVLISARDKLQVREILDEVGDPGACEVIRMKGAFAIEYIPKVPRPPRQGFHDPGHGFPGRDDFQAPDDPTLRPNILRWAGNTGQTIYADLYQEYGGQLTPVEAAAVERWKAAVQQQQQRGRGRGAAAAAAAEPWVTEQQLTATGLLDNPYHIQADQGRTEYGRYSSRILKQVTKHFFPRTHEALKPLADASAGLGDYDDDDDDHDESIMALRAALSADVKDKEKEDELDRKRARLMVAANSGDRNAILQIMTDQTANVYGPEDDDDEDELDTDEDYNDSSDDGMDVLNAIRHGRAFELAAALGVQR